jgi:hypothetical protein
MKTKDKWLGLAVENARQRYKALEIQDELEDYDNYETTIERLEARGFIDGLQEGIMAGYDYAIYLLGAEGFKEHAHILRAQRSEIESQLDRGNE